MADVKWFKITTDMFQDEKLRLIDALPERDTIHYIWMRLLSQAGKCNANGKIFLNENMSYSQEMLSILFNRPIDLIRVALNTLCKLSMISIEEDDTILIINWDKHQNIEGMNRIREQTKKRVSNHRNKQNSNNEQVEEVENISVEECSVTEKTCNVTEKECNVTVTQQNKNKNKNKKEEIDKEIEREKDKEIEILEDKAKAEKIRSDSLSVLLHYEKLTGILGIFSLGALSMAIAQHGVENVRKAIDKSLEANKVNMTYVNGILRNWRRDGYPNGEERFRKAKSMLSNGNEFKGFKPKKPRKLTAKELSSSAYQLI